MKEWEHIIKKNLERARLAENVSNSIKRAQIEEILLKLKAEGHDLSPKKIKSSFEKSFSLPAVSSDYLELIVALTKDHSPEQMPRITSPKVMFLQNPLWHNAAEQLTLHLESPKLVTGADLRSLCEAVSTSKADYCILPLCSTKDGYYPTFLKLIKSFELKICKTVQLIKQDTDEEISFALLSKHVETCEGCTKAVFTFTESPEVSLAPLLYALCSYDCRPLSIISLPLEYNIELFEHRIELLLNDLPVIALLFFLDSAVPGYTLHGIY